MSQKKRNVSKVHNPDSDHQYLIVRPENGRIVDIFRLLLSTGVSFAGFLETSDQVGPIEGDHRWIIVVSIVIRRTIAFFRKPMEWTGILVEFVLNSLSENGGIVGFVLKLLKGRVVLPRRNSATFISAIGHLDGRIDLYKGAPLPGLREQIGNKALMDLCMMASKLAYENGLVVRNVVEQHWKMHFVEFYNGWNGKQTNPLHAYITSESSKPSPDSSN